MQTQALDTKRQHGILMRIVRLRNYSYCKPQALITEQKARVRRELRHQSLDTQICNFSQG